MIAVEILTPKGQAFQGDADFVVAPSESGPVGILPNHAPMIAILQAGEVRVDVKGKSTRFNIESGILEIKKNKLMILSNQIN